jgi:NADH dehydrogenase
VRALVRSEAHTIEYSQVSTVRGDVLQPETLRNAMQSCNMVIHLVGIIQENHAHYVSTSARRGHAQCARSSHAERHPSVTFQMSALGTRPNAAATYHQTKWQAEEMVRASGLNWTIFRPSLIYGEGSEFIESMLPLVKAPVTPIISPGMDTGLLQPMHSTIFVRALCRRRRIKAEKRSANL